MAGEFKVTRVTERFHSLVKGLEGAILNFHKVTSEGGDLHERTEAWTAVSVSREALYEYVEYLESIKVSIDRERSVQLRF